MKHVSNARRALGSLISELRARCVSGARSGVWLVPAAWLVALWVYFAVAWIGPYRTPPSWDECEFLRVTVDVYEQVVKQPWRVWRVFLDGRYCIWHASLAGSVLTLPAWWMKGVGYVSAYVAAWVQCFVLIVLAGSVARAVIRDERWRMLAGAAAALCCALAPMTFALGSMVMSEVPSALLMCVALLAYLRAARCEDRCGWALAGLLAYVTIYGRAERGIVFIACLYAAVWVDTWVQHGWRTAVVTGAGYAGMALLTYLWIERWLPTPLTVPRGHVVHGAFLALGVGLSVGAASVLGEVPSARGPLGMMLATAVLLVVWFSWSPYGTSNAAHVFSILAERSTHPMRGIVSCYVWRHMAENYCGNAVAVALKALLLVGGVYALLRAWPGGLVLLALYALQAWKADLEVSRFLFHLHVFAAIVMGGGAVLMARWSERICKRCSMATIAASIAVVMAGVLSVGVVQRGRHAFERYDATLMPTYDRERALWQVLETVTATLPQQARFSVASANPMAFSYQTLATHARMTGRGWEAIGWPPTFDTYLTSPGFDYHVLLAPGPQPSTLFYHSGARMDFERWRRISLDSGWYAPYVDRSFAGGRVALSIVQRRGAR